MSKCKHAFEVDLVSVYASALDAATQRAAKLAAKQKCSRLQMERCFCDCERDSFKARIAELEGRVTNLRNENVVHRAARKKLEAALEKGEYE